MEGEGTFTFQKKPYNAIQLQVSATSTDYDVVVRLQQITGVGRLYDVSPRKSTHKALYRWQVMSQNETTSLMYTLYPLMCTRRKERITECIRAWLSSKDGRRRDHRRSTSSVAKSGPPVDRGDGGRISQEAPATSHSDT